MSATNHGITVITKPQPKQKSRKQIFLRIRKDDDQEETELRISRISIQEQQTHNNNNNINNNNNNNREHCVESKSELPLTIQSSEAHELNEGVNNNKSYKITIASSDEEANLAATRGGPILKNTLPAENLARQLAQLVQRPQLSAEELVLSWPCEIIPSPVEDVLNFDHRFERHEADIEQRGYYPEDTYSSHSPHSSQVSVVSSQRISARLAKQLEQQKQQQQQQLRCHNTLEISNFKEFAMRMQKEFRRQPTISEIPNLSARLAERYNYDKPTTSAAACLAAEKRLSAAQMAVDREKMLPPRKRKQIMNSSIESEDHKIGNGYRQMPKRKVSARQRTPAAVVQNAKIISSSHEANKLIAPPIKPKTPPKANTTPKKSNANNCQDKPNNFIKESSEIVEEKKTCNPLIVLRQDFSTKNLQLSEKRAQIFSNDVVGNINKLPPTILLPPIPPEVKTELSPKNTNIKMRRTSIASATNLNHHQQFFCNRLGLTIHETVKACQVASVELAKLPTQRRSLRVREQEKQKLQTQLKTMNIPPFLQKSTKSNNSNKPALTMAQQTLADLK